MDLALKDIIVYTYEYNRLAWTQACWYSIASKLVLLGLEQDWQAPVMRLREEDQSLAEG